MPLAKMYHEPLFDSSGRSLKLATVEVRKTNDTLATLYSSASAGTTLPNPTQADALGNLLIWTHETEVRLVVTPVGGTAGTPYSVRTTLSSEVGAGDLPAPATGGLAAGTVGSQLAELEERFVALDPRDYGAKLDRVTDDTAAWQALIADIGDNENWRAARITLAGTSAISDTLLFTRKAILMEGAGFAGDPRDAFPTEDTGNTGFRWIGTVNDRPMLRFSQSIGTVLRGFHMEGHTDPLRRPTAAISLFRNATGESQPNTRNAFRDLWIGQRLGYDPTGVYFTNGVLIEGGDNNNDQVLAENVVFRSCGTGWNNGAAARQAVAQKLLHCQFVDCGTGIITGAHMDLDNPLFLGSTVRDLDVNGRRVFARSLSGELSAQLARVRGGGALVIDGEYWQVSNNISADGRIIDAVEDARNVVRLSNLDVRTRSGYTGPAPLIAVRRAGTTAAVVPVLDVNEVRYTPVSGTQVRLGSAQVDAPTPTRVTVR
jgi:hypothetical protein